MNTFKKALENIICTTFKIANKYFWGFFIILSILIGYISFKNLGSFMVLDWDEARHGVSAYEMLKNNEYIINTYNYANDYWNLKPVLSFWPIILAFKMFGVSIFSMRFFSAFFLLLTSILVSLYLYKKHGKLQALISLATFSACSPFYYDHMGRHGDADSMFMLFFTIAMLSMLLLQNKKFYIYICSFAFSLAFLTKSWHAFSIVVIGGLFLLLTGEIKKLNIKQWIIFILSFTLPILSWIIIRVVKDGPKFIIEMVRYDLLQRSSQAIEGHTGTIWYYFDYLLSNNRFLMLLIILIILVGIGYFSSKLKNNKNEIIGFILWIFIPFAIFTKAETKLFWYIIPVIIPIIMVNSIFIVEFLKEKSLSIFIRFSIVLIFMLTISYYSISMIKFVNSPETDNVQTFISENVQGNNYVNGRNAFIQLEDSNWSQSRLLVSEFSGDLKCINGGIDSFILSNNRSILITSKEILNDNLDKLSNFDILSDQNGLLIISN